MLLDFDLMNTLDLIDYTMVNPVSSQLERALADRLSVAMTEIDMLVNEITKLRVGAD